MIDPQMAPIEFVIVGLAAWRLASLLINEEGPFDVFSRLRDRLFPEGELTSTFLVSLFTCMWCMSIWTAAFCLALWYLFPILVIILAASSVAIMFERFVR